MEQKQVSRRSFFKGTATLAGAAGAVLSVEEQHLLAFQQERGGAPPGERGTPPQGFQFGGRGAAPAIPDIPGPVPTLKLGGMDISRFIAGHNIVMGQAHEGGSGLLYVSALVRAYFTEDKVMETFAAYEEHGINCSGARMAANMADYIKKYMARGGNLHWMAGIMSERDIAMANDTECELGYVHGITADGAVSSEGGAEQIATLLEQMKEAGMVSGVCCHSLDVPIALEEAGVKPAFYVKTINPSGRSMSGGDVPESSGQNEAEVAEQAVKATTEFMANVDVPWIGFKVLGAGRISPNDAFEFCFQHGCDGLLVGMYDFQVANNANLSKQLLQEKDDIDRTRPWHES